VSETFAGCAARLAGLVCRQLCWRPADFWAATPAEIAAIFAQDESPPGESVSRTELDKLMERDRHG